MSKLDDLTNSKRKFSNNTHDVSTSITETKTTRHPLFRKETCDKCSGSGVCEHDITHLKKICGTCSGRGFISSQNYDSIQNEIREIDEFINSRFEKYTTLLIEKYNRKITKEKAFYLSRGEDYRDSEEALSCFREIIEQLRSSRSYKQISQIYEKDCQDFLKGSADQPRPCRILYPCHDCLGCDQRRIPLKYKKLKLIFDRENKFLIEKFSHLSSKYSSYRIINARKDREEYNKYLKHHPFDKWVSKEEQKRKNLYTHLRTEKEKCLCSVCKGKGYYFEDSNLIIGKNIEELINFKTLELRYVLREKCQKCCGSGEIMVEV